ncbi:hypothetical protein GGP80_003182 [Salinibacter ruber]|jgi:hypothetical protein|nr:hypothetical protein [Salinibacter ruber]MCS3937173.1 hypothetical protein [Salinibacter ruber]MCS4099948.1 hypothetical protein [Salinibacter ruber]MCS4119567.1 hypothetical protein [Salinibacter ruber]
MPGIPLSRDGLRFEELTTEEVEELAEEGWNFWNQTQSTACYIYT